MKPYLPYIFIVIGALIFFNGLIVAAYAGSVIALIFPLIGIGLAVFGLRRLRSK